MGTRGLSSVHLPIRLCPETQRVMWLLTHKNKRRVASLSSVNSLCLWEPGHGSLNPLSTSIFKPSAATRSNGTCSGYAAFPAQPTELAGKSYWHLKPVQSWSLFLQSKMMARRLVIAAPVLSAAQSSSTLRASTESGRWTKTQKLSVS